MWNYTIYPFSISLQWTNYHVFTFGFLVPVVLVLMGIASRSYVIPLYTYTMIFNGSEDLMYYIMLGQPVSNYMAWTGFSPFVVYSKIALTMAFVIGIDLMIRYKTRGKHSQEES
jgi:hypothetical protein